MARNYKHTVVGLGLFSELENRKFLGCPHALCAIILASVELKAMEFLSTNMQLTAVLRVAVFIMVLVSVMLQPPSFTGLHTKSDAVLACIGMLYLMHLAIHLLCSLLSPSLRWAKLSVYSTALSMTQLITMALV